MVKFELKQYNTGVLQNFEFCNTPFVLSSVDICLLAKPVSLAPVGAEKCFDISIAGGYSEKIAFFVIKEPISVGTAFE